MQLLAERYAVPLGQGLDEAKRVLTGDGLDDILRGRAQELRDDRELMYV